MRVGAVVTLKSGGPCMTIESTIGGSECMCIWFDGDNLRRHAFPTDALREFKQQPTPAKGLKDRVKTG